MAINRSIPYVDAEARVNGTINYVLNMRVPGMLHAAVHRSPYPHARIVSIDAIAAREVPGVAGVLTRDDIVRNPDIHSHFGPTVRDQPIVAIDRVRFVGEPVAAVAAEDKEIADYAASLIVVEYDSLPAVFDVVEALAPDAPLLYETPLGRDQSRTGVHLRDVAGTNLCNYFTLVHGDIALGFSQAEYVFEDVFRTPATQHVPPEPHVAIAEVKNRSVTVWSATQTPYIVRAALAELFNLPQNRVGVSVTTLGGGYGGKTQPKLEPLTAALAWKAGRPVRLALTRAEEFITITRHASVIRLRTGVKKTGELVARECEIWLNGGAYADRSPNVAEVAGQVVAGPYRVPHVKVISRAVYTNLPPAGAFRGFGSVQAAWAGERQMDMIAARLGLDPVAFRRMNLLRPGDAFCTGETMNDVDFEGVLDAAARAIDWGKPSRSSDSAKARGKGIAIAMKNTITPSTSTAMVRVNSDGTCVVLASTVEMGQGSNTVLTQIAANELGLSCDLVSIAHPDTDVTPYDLSTNASRSTFMMGTAVRRAAQDARRQLITFAAELLEADPGDLTVRDGSVYVKDGSKRLSFADILKHSCHHTVMATGTFITQGGLDPETGQGVGSAQWHHAASGVVVEVDRETGKVDVLKLHTAIYAGRAINPANVELQTEGSAAFGLGGALFEEMIYDDGKLVNANLSDYMIPALEDMPRETTVSIHENPSPEAEVHGVGETGLPPVAPAIGNAVFNAVGAQLMSLPITPEKVVRVMYEGPEQIEIPGSERVKEMV